MTWKQFRFCLICLLLWPAAIFVCGQMQRYVANLLWWLAHQSGATTMPRTLFASDAALPLAFADGFILGLIPLERLRNVLAAGFGRFRYKSSLINEMKAGRPIFWVWLLPSLFFLIRFTAWNNHADSSVLGNSTPGLSRFGHFFGPLNTANLADDPNQWLLDRILFTAPMLFTLAYPLAVWLRHRLPELRHSSPTEVDAANPPSPQSLNS